MELRYSTRSRFFAPIEAALLERADNIRSPLAVDLGPGGYERDVTVVVSGSDGDTFETTWASNHPSRFSARIRAAATVLHRLGIHGRFQISLHGGTLTVRRVTREPGSAHGFVHMASSFNETPEEFRDYE